MFPHRRTQTAQSGAVPLAAAAAASGAVPGSPPPFFAVIVLVAGVAGGLLLVITIIVLCKYCVRNGAHFKLTLCWLRRHNVSRCLGQYDSLDCVPSTSAGKTGSSDHEDGVMSTDDDVRLSSSGGAGWRRKQRALRRQEASTLAMISAPSSDELCDHSTVDQSFVDDIPPVEDDHDIDLVVAQFKEVTAASRADNELAVPDIEYDQRKKTILATTTACGSIAVIHTVSGQPEMTANAELETQTDIGTASVFGTSGRRVSFVLNSDTTRSTNEGAHHSLQRWLTETDCRQPKQSDDFQASSRLSSTPRANASFFLEPETLSSAAVRRSSWLSPHAAETVEQFHVDDNSGNNRRRLWVAAPGILAARRSLPTPTMAMTASKSLEESRSTTGTTGHLTDAVVDVHARAGPDIGQSVPISATRRRSYAASGAVRGNDSSGSAGGSGGGSSQTVCGSMTHSKTTWLCPTIRVSSPPRCGPASNRRLSETCGRRTSASLESAPFNQFGHGCVSGSTPSMVHHRVRSCDADSAAGRRCYARVVVTETTASAPTARRSPAVSRGADDCRLVESRSPSIHASDLTSCAAIVAFTSAHYTSSSVVANVVETKPMMTALMTASARPTLKAKLIGVLGDNGSRVPRYNDPGSFEEVNEDLLYNKQVFKDGVESLDRTHHNRPPLVRRTSTAVPVVGSGSDDRRRLNTDSITITVIGVGSQPTSPNCPIGNSVQMQYRELWDLRATIEEQECLTAIRLETASSPEPEIPDENAESSNGIAGASLDSTTRNTDSCYLLSASGDRLTLPVSRRQMYRSAIENRLTQRRCGSGTTGCASDVHPKSPSANCSVDSFETDGDVSDTSRHDVTTTSFESSTTTTTTDNNTDCTSDARATADSYRRHEHREPGSGIRNSPTSSVPRSATWARSIETPSISGASLSPCSASYSDVAVDESKFQPLTHASRRHCDVAAATTRGNPLLSASSTASVFRSAAKKRRDFRKYERSMPAYSPDRDANPEMVIGNSSPADKTVGSIGSPIDGDTTAAPRGRRNADLRSPVWPLSRWVANDALGSHRRGSSTVENFRASMTNWWYHRHSDASSGYRDYSVDEKTNAVFNEFLRYDRSLDNISFLQSSQCAGSSPVLGSPFHHHRHHHHRSHHHNPLHQHRWRHRVYCTTGSPAGGGSFGSTSSDGTALVKPQLPALTLERQRRRYPISSSTAATGTALTTAGRAGSGPVGPMTVGVPEFRRSVQSPPTAHTDGDLLAAAPVVDSTRRRSSQSSAALVAPALLNSPSLQDSVDTESHKTRVGGDRKPSLTTSMTQ